MIVRKLDNYKDFVFPGHPITIAVFIMQRFDSLSEAQAYTKGHRDWPDTLGDPRVPGCGGPVHSALDFLRNIRIGGWEVAVERAEEAWKDYTTGCYDKYFEDGAAMAEEHKALVREYLDNGWSVEEPNRL